MTRRGGGSRANTKGESFAIVTAEGQLVRELPPLATNGAAISVAQRRAELGGEGTTLYVEHRHLLGPSVRTHRVDHVEGGVVFTTVLSNTI